MADSDTPDKRLDKRVREALRADIHDAFISGLAVVIPIIVTVLILGFVVNWIYRYFDIISDFVPNQTVVPLIPGLVVISPDTLVELLAPVVLIAVVLGVGFVVNSSAYGERAVDYFDYVITQIPGVGSVYDSFRQMSNAMLESDSHSFREVKLVEFPHKDAYTLGFVTTETPDVLREPTNHDEMLTLFLPLAPNPVMGGHLVHFPASQVMDVDMTVEEGLRAIVTSGVAIDGHGDAEPSLSEEKLKALSGVDPADRQFDPERAPSDAGRDASNREAVDGSPAELEESHRDEDAPR